MKKRNMAEKIKMAADFKTKRLVYVHWFTCLCFCKRVMIKFKYFSSPELCFWWAFVRFECPSTVIHFASFVVCRAATYVKRQQLQCLDSSCHSFYPIFLKIAQNLCLDNVLFTVENRSGQMRNRSNPSKILFTL